MSMMELEKLLAAVGSLAELCKVFYDECLSQNFEEPQAFALTMQFLQNILGGIE